MIKLKAREWAEKGKEKGEGGREGGRNGSDTTLSDEATRRSVPHLSRIASSLSHVETKIYS